MDGFVVAVPLMRLARLHQNKSAAARDLEDLESSSKLPSSTSAISRPVTGAKYYIRCLHQHQSQLFSVELGHGSLTGGRTRSPYFFPFFKSAASSTHLRRISYPRSPGLNRRPPW